jgi:hypothetical protein
MFSLCGSLYLVILYAPVFLLNYQLTVSCVQLVWFRVRGPVVQLLLQTIRQLTVSRVQIVWVPLHGYIIWTSFLSLLLTELSADFVTCSACVVPQQYMIYGPVSFID